MSSEPLPPHPPLGRYYPDGGASGDEHRAFVIDLFDRTAPHYNWIQGVMSFGAGLRYRRDALERAGLAPGMRVLDIAVGTGLTARAALEVTGGSSSVIGLDASAGMLHVARSVGIPLVRALAEHLPVATDSVDFLTMGYALRHVDDLKATFREYHRVLRPGGRLMVLELTRPTGSRWRDALARVYLQQLVPLVAQLGPGGSEARKLMEYCWDTVEGCVPPSAVLEALRGAGFGGIEARNRWIFSEYLAMAT